MTPSSPPGAETTDAHIGFRALPTPHDPVFVVADNTQDFPDKFGVVRSNL